MVGFVLALLSASSVAWAEGEESSGGSRYEKFGIGPSLVIGVPHPINLAVDARLHPLWSVGVGGGYFPLKVPIGGNSVKLTLINYEARGRWHPFSGAFFLGTAFGQQRLSVQTSKSLSTSVTVSGVAVPVTANVDVLAKIKGLYATPHIGWMWIFDSGFLIGLELGAQIGFASKTTVDIGIKASDPRLDPYIGLVRDQKTYKDAVQQIQDMGKKIGNMPLPFLSLLRLGWMF